MFTPSKFGGLIATFGLVGGAFYSFKSNRTALVGTWISLGAGIGGYLIGNAITKFYEQ